MLQLQRDQRVQLISDYIQKIIIIILLVVDE
jgi:hypothetical protein